MRPNAIRPRPASYAERAMTSSGRTPAPRRPIPWKVVMAVGLKIAEEGKRRWDLLSHRDQQEIVRIVRKSKGRISNITAQERAELRRIVTKVSKLW
jgi:hypothetical protein